MENNQKKQTNLMIRIDLELFEKYKEFCERKGFAMSKHLRNFIKLELENEKTN